MMLTVFRACTTKTALNTQVNNVYTYHIDRITAIPFCVSSVTNGVIVFGLPIIVVLSPCRDPI